MVIARLDSGFIGTYVCVYVCMCVFVCLGVFVCLRLCALILV